MQQQIVEMTYQQHFEPLLTAEETAVHLRCHVNFPEDGQGGTHAQHPAGQAAFLSP